MTTPFRSIAALALAGFALTGCDQKENWELVVSNGIVYRINKQSGEVSGIVGMELIKIGDAKASKPEQPTRNRTITWPDREIAQLGNLKVKLKTTWRAGKLHYLCEVSPYAGHVEQSRNNGHLIARFYDLDGFELFTLNLPVSEMVRTITDSGETVSATVNSSTLCSQEIYDDLIRCSFGWGGFE